jgi:hypothetical protein
VRIESRDRRVEKFLRRHLKAPAWQWGEIGDPRGRRGRRWELAELLNAAFVGMLTASVTLRDVESLTQELGQVGRKQVSRRVPDTTLWDLFSGRRRVRKAGDAAGGRAVATVMDRPLCPEDFRRQLRQQVRFLWRSKCLQPQDLPCGVLSIDGKGLGKLEHDGGGQAQKSHHADGSPYWLARVLRAALTSAVSKPIVDQLPIGSRTNEMASFGPFFRSLVHAYDALFEIITTDAGMTSLANATQVHQADKGYVMALKDNQPELLREAKRLLSGSRRGQSAACSTETYRGQSVTRALYRSAEIAGYHGWTHLRQVWLVEQRSCDAQGNTRIERRFFVTNLHPGRLTAAQTLTLVRLHWGIENDAFWSLDMQWREDSIPWCASGNAVEVLSLMRLMAYNLVQLARKRSLRPRGHNAQRWPIPCWRDVLRWMRDALRLDIAPPADPATES